MRKLAEQTYYQKNKDERKQYQKGYRLAHKPHQKAYMVVYAPEYYQNLRKKVFRKLGNKCSNSDCSVLGGCTDLRCLQIDHVSGGGSEELRRMSRITFLKKVLADTKGEYQLLCANCNWIKRHENVEDGSKKIVLGNQERIDLWVE